MALTANITAMATAKVADVTISAADDLRRQAPVNPPP